MNVSLAVKHFFLASWSIFWLLNCFPGETTLCFRWLFSGLCETGMLFSDFFIFFVLKFARGDRKRSTVCIRSNESQKGTQDSPHRFFGTMFFFRKCFFSWKGVPSFFSIFFSLGIFEDSNFKISSRRPRMSRCYCLFTGPLFDFSTFIDHLRIYKRPNGLP